MTRLTDMFVARVDDDRPGCTVEGRTSPWSRIVTESSSRAEILKNFLDPSQNLRFAVLIDDVQEHVTWMGAALLSESCMTGLDSARPENINRSALQSSNCQFVVADEAGLRYLEHLGYSPSQQLNLNSTLFLSYFADLPRCPVSIREPDASPLLCSLIVDSPEFDERVFDASHDLIAFAAREVARATEMTYHDICYDSLPRSCANSVLACWGPAAASGAEIVFQRGFTPASFMADVREFNCTNFIYVGSMITELLDMPRTDLDGDHRLRFGFGTGATLPQMKEFEARFGCELIDGNRLRPQSS